MNAHEQLRWSSSLTLKPDMEHSDRLIIIGVPVVPLDGSFPDMEQNDALLWTIGNSTMRAFASTKLQPVRRIACGILLQTELGWSVSVSWTQRWAHKTAEPFEVWTRMVPRNHVFFRISRAQLISRRKMSNFTAVFAKKCQISRKFHGRLFVVLWTPQNHLHALINKT